MKGVIMQNFFKILFLISVYFFPVNLGFTQDNIEDKENMVEVRQTAMQAMWLRLDRLSTLIAQPGDIVTSSDGSAIVIGSENKTEPREYYTLIHGKDPSQDAQEIYNLLREYQIAEQITNSEELSKKINFDLNNLDFTKNENALKDMNELGDKILKTTFNEVVKLNSK